FVDWEDLARWALIARQLGMESTEAVETYSTSEHLFTDLDIPETAKGTLPKEKRTRKGLDAEEIEDLGGPDSAGRSARDRRDGGRGGRGRRNGSRQRESTERRSEENGSGRPRRKRSVPAPAGSTARWSASRATASSRPSSDAGAPAAVVVAAAPAARRADRLLLREASRGAQGRMTEVPPAPRSSIAASTSGAVRFSPSSLGFPDPW